MEMQSYQTIEEMLHKAILVEKQLKRRGVTRPQYPSKPSYNKGDKPTYPPRTDFKPKADYKSGSSGHDYKGKVESTPIRNRDIECFKCRGKGHYANKCPNARAMMILENGEIVIDEEDEVERAYI